MVWYTSFLVGSDEGVSLMFYCQSQCPEICIIELFVTLEDMNGSSRGSAPNPPYFGTDFSARGLDLNPIACPTSLAVPSLTFALYNPLQIEDIQRGNTEDVGDGRSLRQLVMQIAKSFMGDGPIAGFESFVDHRDDKEKPL